MEIIIKKKKIDLGEFSVDYFLTEEKDGKDKFYSVILNKHTYDKTTSVKAPYLTKKKKRAERFFELLTENTVTPISLIDIAEDYFS